MAFRCLVTDIDWDVDDELELDVLPTDIIHTFDVPEEELDDYVSDWLSDNYGYCHKGFALSCEEVKNERRD